MRKLIEAFIIIGGFVLAFRIGWLAPAFALVIFLFACGLQLFSFTKSPTFNAQFFLIVATLLFAGLVLLLVAAQVFDGTPPAATERGARGPLPTDYAVGDLPWGAALLVVAAGASIFLLIAYVVGRTTYGLHEAYGARPLDATLNAAHDLLGSNKGIWVVSNGQSQIVGDRAGDLELIGGPGTLIVQDGHAVILERQGNRRRVVRNGMTTLAPFERVSMIVPTGPRSERLEIHNLMTADQVPIDSFSLLVFHRLCEPGSVPVSTAGVEADAASPPAETDGAPEKAGFWARLTRRAPTPVAIPADAFERLLLDTVWNPVGRDWTDAVRSISENATRDIVGRFNVDAIVPLCDETRNQFRALLLAQINKVTVPLLGVAVTTVDFGEIRVPPDVLLTLVEKQVSRWKAQIAVSEQLEAQARTDAETYRMSKLETARAQAQQEMMEAIAAGFKDLDDGDTADLLRLRLIEAFERMADGTATTIVMPAEMLQILERIRPQGARDGDGVAPKETAEERY